MTPTPINMQNLLYEMQEHPISQTTDITMFSRKWLFDKINQDIIFTSYLKDFPSAN